MKTAVFMRHGHAAEGSDDHGRELTRAGELAARSAAFELKSKGFRPDVILCSTARRALATAEIVADVFANGVTPEAQEELYLASPEAALQCVRGVSDTRQNLLLVGHNPGLEDLGLRLGEPRALSPAAFFMVKSDATKWEDFVR